MENHKFNWVIFHSHVGLESNPKKNETNQPYGSPHGEAVMGGSGSILIQSNRHMSKPSLPRISVPENQARTCFRLGSLCHYVLDLYHFLSLCRNDLGHSLVFTPPTVSNRGTLLQRSNRVPSPKRFDRFGSPPSCCEPRKMVIPPHQPHINIHQPERKLLNATFGTDICHGFTRFRTWKQLMKHDPSRRYTRDQMRSCKNPEPFQMVFPNVIVVFSSYRFSKRFTWARKGKRKRNSKGRERKE